MMDEYFEANLQSTLRGFRNEIEYHKTRIADLERQCERVEEELMINRVWADRTEADLTNKNIHIREELE